MYHQNSDIYVCDFCDKEFPFIDEETQYGPISECEECGAHFCDSCFSEKFGADALHDMMRGEKLLCPKCYEKTKKARKQSYELRQIFALPEGETGWAWNDSSHMCCFTTAGDPNRAFLRRLHRNGLNFRRGTVRVVYDANGDVYELQLRGTGEPLFAMLPCEA